MSDPAGRLKILLERRPQGLVCRIQSTRPVSATALFSGRPPGQTATMLPMLYSICAKAQAFACVGALELATGIAASAEVWRMRRLTVQLETIREHLWRMLLDWPRLAGADSDQNGMSALLRRLKPLVGLADPAGTLFRLGAQEATLDRRAWSLEAAELEVLLSELVFGCPVAAWIERVEDFESLAAWARGAVTPPARLLCALLEANEEAIGRSEITPLPDTAEDTLAERLLADDWREFVAAPQWDGRPRETSPFTRHLGSTLLRALTNTLGNGLLPRLAAQLTEVARLTAEIRAPLGPSPGRADACDGGKGVGMGQADAARGRLIHLARTEDGQVLDYRILAPTEWNFHPQGALAAGLAALPEGTDADLRRRAELLIMATDPCVAYDLSIDGAEAAP